MVGMFRTPFPPRLAMMAFNVVIIAVNATTVMLGSKKFKITTADAQQEALFGSAASQGWLGGSHAASFHLADGRYLWMFGDSFTNITAKNARTEGNPMAECNYFTSQHCSMPTNTFALWDGAKSGVFTALKFDMQFDPRSGYPTSTLWPPGWGGRGRTPKTPSCDSCSLWQAPTTLQHTEAECLANGATNVLIDKGSCCSTNAFVCRGYCCHHELYFRPMSGIASLTDDRVLIMVTMGKHSSVMPNEGRTYATFAVVISNTSTALTGWEYTADRMPGTHVWPWSTNTDTKEFNSAISRANLPEQPDLVYLLGMQGMSKVLARANLSDILEYRWKRLQFWSIGKTWKPYAEVGMPALLPIFNSTSEAVSFEFDKRLNMWLLPEVETQTKVIKFRVASQVTGPYTTMTVGTLPSDVVHSDLSNWHVKSVINHPELVSNSCQWVLSMVFYWAVMDAKPPSPGLHYFPRLVCIRGLTETVTSPPPAMPDSTMRAEPEPTRKFVCNTTMLRKIESTLACSDMGDGCHTCRQRAQWIVRHNGRTLEVAYGIVAAEFPQGCGAVLQCKAQLAHMTGLEEDWEIPHVASNWRTAVLSAAPVVFMASSFAILTLSIFTAMCRNCRLAQSRHEVLSGVSADIFLPQPSH